MGGDDNWAFCDFMPVPWWHPMRWLGYSWRRWVYNDGPSLGDPTYDGSWQGYQTHDQRAREYLKEQFGGSR